MTPLLLDINGPEFILLLILAIIIFGPERLPDLARKAARVVAYVRSMASQAQGTLKDELGPGFENLDFRDINPKTFVQKHLLSDVEPIVADVRKELSEAGAAVAGTRGDVRNAIHGVAGDDPEQPDDEPVRVLTPFDIDAT